MVLACQQPDACVFAYGAGSTLYEEEMICQDLRLSRGVYSCKRKDWDMCCYRGHPPATVRRSLGLDPKS
jgi:hypothetical protein